MKTKVSNFNFNLESILEVKLNSLESTQKCKNKLITSRIIFVALKLDVKHVPKTKLINLEGNLIVTPNPCATTRFRVSSHYSQSRWLV